MTSLTEHEILPATVQHKPWTIHTTCIRYLRMLNLISRAPHLNRTSQIPCTALQLTRLTSVLRQYSVLRPHSCASTPPKLPFRTHLLPSRNHPFRSIPSSFIPASHRSYHNPPSSTMSDDASYTSFLEKANADPKANSNTHEQASSTSERRTQFDPTTGGTTSSSNISPEVLPASLKSLPDITYVSDTDSPFEPVVFNYADSTLPSKSDFEKCLHHKHHDAGAVEELSTQGFDPRGEYTEIIERVEKAGNGAGVKVFRVEVSKTRAEYYIVTVGERMLIGVVAKAVES